MNYVDQWITKHGSETSAPRIYITVLSGLRSFIKFSFKKGVLFLNEIQR